MFSQLFNKMSGPTYYAIVLHSQCSDKAAQFIFDNLMLSYDRGGGGLEVRRQVASKVAPETVLHVSCSDDHLRRVAEDLEIRKADRDGHIRPVSCEDWSQWPDTGRVGPLDISDIHRCVQFCIDRVHLPSDLLPGHEDKKFVLAGSPIVHTYQEHNLVTGFPVHDQEALQKLTAYWRRGLVLSPPTQDIRNYFGESVALYYSFVESYTKLLALISGYGVFLHICQRLEVDHVTNNLLFCFITFLAIGLFFEIWKRKCNRHSYTWGTFGKLRLKPPRPEYRGEMRESPVTGKQERHFPEGRRRQRVLVVSVPIIIVCLVIAVTLMRINFAFEAWMVEFLVDSDADSYLTMILSNIPGVLYSIIIMIFNKIYFKVSHHLTDFENHRTEEQHNLNITLKLISFEFVNTFLALFWVGLINQDLPALRSQLFTTMIVQAVINQVTEVLLPYFLHKPAAIKLQDKMTRKLGLQEEPKLRIIKGIKDLSEDDANIAAVHHDILADPLPSLHDDFMELWLQFGHVFLFASVYPLAAALALVNNITEMFSDRYKMVHLSRKPKARAVRDIGGWFLGFKFTAIVSIITNCSLMAIDMRVSHGSSFTDMEWYGMFVVIEHIMVFLFLGLDKMISDTPADVKRAIDRTEYLFKQKHVHVKQD